MHPYILDNSCGHILLKLMERSIVNHKNNTRSNRLKNSKLRKEVQFHFEFSQLSRLECAHFFSFEFFSHSGTQYPMILNIITNYFITFSYSATLKLKFLFSILIAYIFYDDSEFLRRRMSNCEFRSIICVF